MPVVKFDEYCKILDHAKKNKYALPAINITSPSTINAALSGLSRSKSDGILQVSFGAAQFQSGQDLKDNVLGAVSLAEHIHLVAERYDVYVMIHTDHCQKDKLDTFVLPLIDYTEQRRAKGCPNLFSSHMFDGSELSLEENLQICKKILQRCKENDLILELEIGIVGGEEDGIQANRDAKLYTTPEDMKKVVQTLGKGEQGRYLLAAVFGNVHGVYKPGKVQLQPKILQQGQALLSASFSGYQSDLVFHGGSGSSCEEIAETLEYGVIKMNIDTDAQYAYTRPVVDHIFSNYSQILKIDGEVGNKKLYDPRSYLKRGEQGMADKIVAICEVLRSTGKSLFGKL